MKSLQNITFGRYIPAQSLLHRLDPRCKILALILIICGIFMATQPYDRIIWPLALLLCAHLAETGLKTLLRSVRPVLLLILFTATLNLFFTGGAVIWEWGILNITREGVALAITMALRLALLVLFANLLTLTTTPSQIADGLESLLSPLKPLGFPAHELSIMMTIALRFIPTLLDETDRIIKAQIARGADLDRGSLLKRTKAFIPVLVPLFVIVFQRADQLSTAMESRAYRGGQGRTRIKPLRWNPADTCAILLCLLLVIGQTILNRKGLRIK